MTESTPPPYCPSPALSRVRPVKVVVPAQERSWVGKAITRFDEVRVERTVRNGVEVFVADGYPADCVQLGVHSLFGEKPDMVLSGINIGLNQGLGFLLSSGTVGAAAEGWIAGLPSIAFSTGSPFDHRGWATEAWSDSSAQFWEAAAALAVDVFADILAAGYPPEVDVLSVNFPTTPASTLRVVSPAWPRSGTTAFSENTSRAGSSTTSTPACGYLEI